MLHDQVIRDKVEAGKNHDSKVVLLWKKSSTCQWFPLLTVCCQRFTHQPIVFLRCEANAYFIGSGCAGSLSFFFSGCRPRFSHLGASPLDALSRTWQTEEKRETARSLSLTRPLRFTGKRGHIVAHDVSWAALIGKHLLWTQDVSEQNQKHFLCLGRKFYVRNKCCARGQTGKHLL